VALCHLWFDVCSLVCDVALFNSKFNRDSFLDNVDTFLHMMPDCRPQDVSARLQSKCHVLYYPVQFVDSAKLDVKQSPHTVVDLKGIGAQPLDQHISIDTCCSPDDSASIASPPPSSIQERSEPLYIVWPHRWYIVSIIFIYCFVSNT